jgi:hypothetical protein
MHKLWVINSHNWCCWVIGVILEPLVLLYLLLNYSLTFLPALQD